MDTLCYRIFEPHNRCESSEAIVLVIVSGRRAYTMRNGPKAVMTLMRQKHSCSKVVIGFVSIHGSFEAT